MIITKRIEKEPVETESSTDAFAEMPAAFATSSRARDVADRLADGRLVGIVTHDDAADALQAETTEDF